MAASATVVIGAIVGATVGLTWGHNTPPQASSSVTVELTPTPTYLYVGSTARALAERSPETRDAPPPVTVDTEAALLRSNRALTRAGRRLDLSASELRSMITVQAPPLSNVLELTTVADVDAESRRIAGVVARSYLVERRRFLEHQRVYLITQLEEQLDRADPFDPSRAGRRTYLRAAIDYLETHRPVVGRVVRRDPEQTGGGPRAVAMTSGAGLGLLAGLALVRTRRHRQT